MSENKDTGGPELIEGIENDARKEASEILEKAKKYVADRLASNDTRLAAIKKEAEEKLASQVEEIRRNSASNIAVKKRKIALQVRDKLISEIIGKVKARFSALMEEPAYNQMLEGWVLEASLGLNCEKAEINASQAEKKMLVPEFIKKIENKVQEISGRQFKLRLSQQPPLEAQGVVVTKADGHTAFNNQVRTRLLRYQAQLRKLIYDALFEDEL